MVDELPYAPWRERGAVAEGEFRWRLGLRPLDLAEWFEFGADGDAWVAEKPALLRDRRSTVFSVLDGIEEECSEIADAVSAHLRRRHPERLCELDSSMHPLEAASRLVPDDFVLMVERDGRLVCGGGSVCFPNRWDLRSKLGLTLSEVHRPVASLNEQLEPAVDRFLDRLTPERSFWRLGWGVIDVPDGFTPADGSGSQRPHAPEVDQLFVRVERETLRRFGGSNCVLFAIRTYITPIVSVMVDVESSVALGAAVEAMSPEIRDYKGLVQHAEPLARKLATR